jgi:N-acetylmuramoyl-L-alanine amidase
MRALWLMAAAALLPLPAGALPGQGPGTWHVVNERGTVAVEPVLHGAYQALPLSTLVALGVEVSYVAGGAEATLDGVRLRFRAGSPEFSVGTASYRLEGEVYEQGGALYVPLGFFRDYLPRASADRVSVDGSARVIRGSVPLARTAARASGTVFEHVTWAIPDSLRDDPPGDSASADSTTADPLAKLVAGASGSADTAIAADPLAQVVARASGAPSPPTGGEPNLVGSLDWPDADIGGDAGRGRRLVVVDAGHGGVDPGTHGPGGTREKDVTLAVARRLAALLRRDTTLEVRMTRDRDTLIALRDRTRFANTWRRPGQAAVFISVHCNSNPSRAARGIETYFLSEAKTEDARRVAAMENAAAGYESASGPSAGSGGLGFILHDLRQNQYLRESSDWAEIIDGRLGTVAGPSRGVKQAGFVVLNGAFMPAVLVEIGFLSNPVEEQRLATPDHQDDVAGELAAAVRAFLNQPRGGAERASRR